MRIEHLNTRGLVLRVVNYLESDRIYTLLTPEQGRLAVRGRGARRSNKRFPGALQPFALSDLDLRRRGTKVDVSEARLVQGHFGIREGLDRLSAASYAAEWALLVAREEEPSEDLFRLLLATFAALDAQQGALPASFPRAFELKLAHVLGLRPALRRCARSGAALAGARVWWSPGAGGAVHAPEGDEGQPVDRAALRELDTLLRTPLSRLSGLTLGAETLALGRRLLPSFLRYHTGFEARSLGALDGALAVAS